MPESKTSINQQIPNWGETGARQSESVAERYEAGNQPGHYCCEKHIVRSIINADSRPLQTTRLPLSSPVLIGRAL